MKRLKLGKPNPFENDNGLEKSLNKYIKDLHSQEECIGFIDGYKASQAKGQYSLEDVKKAIEFAFNAGRRLERKAVSPDFKFETYREEIIQSLSTQQVPKSFNPEYEYLHCSECDGAGWMISCEKCNGEGSRKLSKLKTITN